MIVGGRSQPPAPSSPGSSTCVSASGSSRPYSTPLGSPDSDSRESSSSASPASESPDHAQSGSSKAPNSVPAPTIHPVTQASHGISQPNKYTSHPIPMSL